ncbi:ribonuclease G [Rhodosalinus halophilus]|uniref:Ribonuclease G n=1 Tax=Rhodosalinus halophilus TaxID=2259333 RepID=A0A365UEU8_9RHOB|nr:ribonuclease E/G [Rhodosalinus halophilus]RBI87484.1 ribonuclease G [Rhodosalinus halophilus]
MKGRRVVLGEWRGREAAALMVDGRLDDLIVDTDAPRPGTIYRARPDRPMKGQGGLFLSTPEGRVFLRQTKGVRTNAPLLVQITGYAEPGKAPPVTSRLALKGRFAVLTPGAPGVNPSRRIRDPDRRAALAALAEGVAPSGTGVILRSAAASADEDAVVDELRALAAALTQILGDGGAAPALLLEGDGPHALAWRDWTEPAEVAHGADAFERLDVLDEIAALSDPVTPLAGGARMSVEPTRALVSVDVDTGTDTSPAAALKANLAMARALPRALRLRGLGGQVVVDPAPSPKRDRKQIEGALKAALRADPVETALLGWTALGHIELQRTRARPPLSL